MIKIFYIVDKKNSAIHTAASARVDLSGGEIFIANEYISPWHLLKSINEKEGGIIIFCWRKVLADILSSKKTVVLYNSLKNKFNFVFLIPDHVGLSTTFENFELMMIKASDYYVVTSKLLFDEYSSKYPAQPPKLIFHDLPDLKLIEETRRITPRKNNTKIKIIWVGNSKWGHRQGFNDHKGFKSVLEPFMSEIAKHGYCCDIKVIDSAKEYISPLKVLEFIRNSDILLQTSKNEGTGLTVLEALGLGTNVFSSKVGIAPELLDENHLLQSLNAEDMHSKVHTLGYKKNEDDLYQKFYEHTSKSKEETLVLYKAHKILPSRFVYKQRILLKLYWAYRYISNRTLVFRGKVNLYVK